MAAGCSRNLSVGGPQRKAGPLKWPFCRVGLGSRTLAPMTALEAPPMTDDPDVIGPDGTVRLRCYLPSADSVWFSAGCGHSAPLGIRAAIRLMGPEATVRQLERRLRCSRCGGRRVPSCSSPTRARLRCGRARTAAGNAGRAHRIGKKKPATLLSKGCRLVPAWGRIGARIVLRRFHQFAFMLAG